MDLSQIAHAWSWLLFMVLAFVLGQIGVQWRMKRAALFILKELFSKQAYSSDTAVRVSYIKKSPLHLGMRDLRPKVLESLVQQGLLGMTPDMRFYLIRDNVPRELWKDLEERR